MESALTFMQRYHDDGGQFLDLIITGDETWVTHITPETKQKSVLWRHLLDEIQARKVTYTVFWDRLVPIPRGRLVRHRDTNVGSTV